MSVTSGEDVLRQGSPWNLEGKHRDSSPDSLLQRGSVITPDVKLGDDGRPKFCKRTCVEYCREKCLGSTALLILCSIIGIALGLAINHLNPSAVVVKWVGFPGQLFLRALKCLVIPMIFCNMVVGVAEVAGIGKAGLIGSRTFLIYMATTIIACVEGLVLVVLFRPLFHIVAATGTTVPSALALRCPGTGRYLTNRANDSGLTCASTVVSAANLTDVQKFGVVVLGDVIATKISVKRDVSQTIEAMFNSLVPDNIFTAATTPDVLSVITFSIAFGLMMAKMQLREGEQNYVLNLFDQLNRILQAFVGVVVKLAPYAILSMIAGALASAKDFGALVTNVGIIIGVVTLGQAIHMFITLPSLFAIIVRHNPFAYMKKCIGAYTFAWGCASSGATLPMTMKCVDDSGEVPPSIGRFVLSLGATINMDGSALYFPAAIVFLADVSGRGDDITAGALVMIALVSTLGAVGASPIPNAGLVMLVTIWEAVFPGSVIPEQVAYLQAIDWLLDRGVTTVNVCGDSLVARMVTRIVGEETAPTMEQSKTMDETLHRMSAGQTDDWGLPRMVDGDVPLPESRQQEMDVAA